jgi:hypothetical protein
MNKKEIWILILCLMIGMLFGITIKSCHATKFETHLNFSDIEITVLSDIPDINLFSSKMFNIYDGDKLRVDLWCCHSMEDSTTLWYYLMVYDPNNSRSSRVIPLIYCDSLKDTKWWIDEEYFDGKPASKILRPQVKKPDVQKMIQMRLKGLRYDI